MAKAEGYIHSTYIQGLFSTLLHMGSFRHWAEGRYLYIIFLQECEHQLKVKRHYLQN